MSAGYTNLRTVSYRDTIAELIARANQTHTRATGVQVFSPGDGMAYEDDEGFINPISPSFFDDATRQIAEASESLVATEEELEAAKLILEDNTRMLGELDEQAKATAEEMKAVVADLDEDGKRLTAAQADLDDLKPRLGDVETAVSASDAKVAQAVSDAAHALQEAQQAREYAEGLDPSTGDGSYSEAMQAAQQAARDALAAMERANQAVTSASGKSSVRNATSAPKGVGTAVGDTWFQWTAFPGGTVTGQWTWDGAEWRSVTLSHEVISSLDLGKATVGELEGGRIKAHTMEADRLTIGVGQNAIADPMFTSVDLTNRRMSESVGTWTQNRAGAAPFVSSAGTSAVTFRYSGHTSKRATPTVAGQRWRIQAQVNPGGGSIRTNVRWFDANGGSFYVAASSLATSNEDTSISTIWEAPATAVKFGVDVYSPGASESRTVRIYAGISVQSMTGAVHIEDGAITASKVNAREVAGAIGSFVNVKAENVEVTEALAAKVFSATTAKVAEQFVTDRLVIGTGVDATVLEVLGNAVVNDLNLRGTLRGENAIMSGTITTAQLRVTEDMAATIGRFMELETKKLIVTEAAVMQHVTAIEGIITPKITASEAKMGSLIAEKASIADIQGGNLTITGHFRSGGVGKPGVIIPKNYTFQPGVEQLGVWLAPDGKAPSLGSAWGRTAGMWLDNASNVAGSKNSSALLIRGQDGAGVRVMGGLSVGNANGDAVITSAGDGDMLLRSRLGDVSIIAGGNVEASSAGTTFLTSYRDMALRTDSYLVFHDSSASAYAQTPGGSSYVQLLMNPSNGRVYRSTSARRYKADIKPFVPDPKWLDMPVVTYVDADDAVDKRVQIGTIAEDALEYSADPLVMWSSEGAEDYRYEREVPVLRYFLREHRDKIADLESRIAELESALL